MKVMTYPARRHAAFRPFFAPTFHANKRAKNAAVNVAETDDNFRLEIAAPGWNKEDFNIELDQDVLTISAKKEAKETETVEKYLRQEFAAGSFNRRFSLPETIDTEAIKAKYLNGILTLILPKREEAKPTPARKVEIA